MAGTVSPPEECAWRRKTPDARNPLGDAVFQTACGYLKKDCQQMLAILRTGGAGNVSRPYRAHVPAPMARRAEHWQHLES